MSKIKEYLLDQYEKEGETMPKQRECEVCWAGKEGYQEETPLYEYKGATYCQEDLDRATTEAWHNA